MTNKTEKNSLKVLLITPWLMVAIRLLIALAILIDALDGSTGNLFVPALILGVALDLADGMVARKLGAASLPLRRADSFTDIVFFYSVISAAWLVYSELIKPFYGMIILVVVLQVTTITIALIKYRAVPAYHTWCSRFAGVLLFLASLQLFVFQSAGILLLIALLTVCLSCIESICITLLLDKPTSDIPGVLHAVNLRYEHKCQ